MEDEGESPSSSEIEEENEVSNPTSKPSNRIDSREQYEVMSEVHLGCPPHLSGPHLSHFTFPAPPEFDAEGRRHVQPTSNYPVISLDEDGDLVLTRRKNASKNCRMIIQHNITSTIPSVGLQVWRAELVLADFVLHGMFTSNNFDGITAVELGAGTGLLGILLARVAKTVFLTDYGDEILNNCAINVERNSEIFENHRPSVSVRELDWNKAWPTLVGQNEVTNEERCKYAWTPSEIEEADNASLLLAADVIYNDELTDALFSTLQVLMSRGSEKVLYLALEKRYNFSVNDLNVVANGYSHFLSYLKDEEECRQLGDVVFPCFVGKYIDVADIPQYVREYDRENNVEIWEIKYLQSAFTY